MSKKEILTIKTEKISRREFLTTGLATVTVGIIATACEPLLRTSTPEVKNPTLEVSVRKVIEDEYGAPPGPHYTVLITGKNILTNNGIWTGINQYYMEDGEKTTKDIPPVLLAYQGPDSIFSGITIYGQAHSIEGKNIKPITIQEGNEYLVRAFTGPPPSDNGDYPQLGQEVTSVEFSVLK